MASIDNITLTCGVCQKRGKSVAPVIWCPDCNNALCSLCQKQHQRSNDSINHEVITIDIFLKLQPYLKHISTICGEHRNRFNSYCLSDEVPLCSKCPMTKHKSCRTTPLSDAIRNSKSSVAMDALKESINDIMSNFEKIVENRLDNVARLNKETNQIKEDIFKIRYEVNSVLDSMEHRILERLSIVEKDNTNKITRMLKGIEGRQKKIDNLKCTLEDIQNHATDFQTFFAIKLMDTMILEENKHLQSLVEPKKLNEFSITFNSNKTLQSLKREMSTFGEIYVVNKPSNISLIRGYTCTLQVPVRSHNSKLSLSQRFDVSRTISSPVQIIAFCQLANGQFAFLDGNGRIIVHNNDGSLSFSFKFEIKKDRVESDMTYIDDTTIAVSEHTKIHFIDIASKKTRKISDFGDTVYGIGRISDKKLLCCTYTYGVYLMNLTDFSRYKWCRIGIGNPHYIVIWRNKAFISYSDTVLMVDNKKNIHWKFSDETILSSASKITSDAAGNIYVIGRATKNLVFISSDGKRCIQLLVKEDFPNEPWGELNGIHYDTKENRLIIVNMFGNVLIYNVKNSDM